MNKEYIKEIIKSFLQNEEENYKAITEMNVSDGVKEESFKRINFLKTLIKHLDTDYEVFFEVIVENLNKEVKKSSKSNK